MSETPSMHVTVFGGTGFLGSVIVECLLAGGHRVRVAARHRRPGFAPASNASIEFRRVDVREEGEVAAALSQTDAAVNAVSLYVEQRDASFEAIHVEAARRVARLAHEQGVRRLVHVSGIGVDTQSPSAYVRSRARGEQAVREAFPEAVVVRPSVLVSPTGGMLETLDHITRLPVVPLFGDGRVRLQPVDVTDAALAVREALRRDVEGTFELGGAEVVRYRELLEAVLAAAGRWRPMLPVFMPLCNALAFVLSALPSPPLTRDQLVLMSRDNVVAEDARGFEALGLLPRGIRDVLGERMRPG